MTKAHAILEYLQHTGAKKEAGMYLKLFKSVEPRRFAIIAIDSQTLAFHEPDAASALAYLSSLGFAPIVLHDAARAVGRRLAADIRTGGGKCDVIINRAQLDGSLGATLAKATQLIHAKTIPIVETGEIEGTLRKLLHDIRPRKLIFLSRLGGIRTRRGELLSYVNLPHEYEGLSKAVAAECLHTLKLSSGILSNADWKLHIEIVPPTGLLTELFTIKGSGTFVKKGPKISKLAYRSADAGRIKKLLEESFGRKLDKGYLVSKKSDAIFFVEENYNGVAIVNKAGSLFYIDKLAVLPEMQGEGLARDIITSVMSYCGKVFWRAKPDNHINEWYLKLCSGMQKAGSWYVYWAGLDIDEMEPAIAYASRKPADFIS